VAFRSSQELAPLQLSAAMPVPLHYLDLSLNSNFVVTLHALQDELDRFFRHLETTCVYFRWESQEVYLENIRSSLLDTVSDVSDPIHMTYLAKALDFLKHTAFASSTQFGVLPQIYQSRGPACTCECEAIAGGALFQPLESHASRAAAVVDHLTRQSRYLFKTLSGPELERVMMALIRYAGDSGPINRCLLDGQAGQSTAQGEDDARVLMNMFEDPNFPGIKGPFTFYRGVGSSLLGHASPAPSTVGRSILHSTTTDPGTMQNFGSKAKWLIQVPAGSEVKVFNLAQWCLKKENELILGPTRLDRVTGFQEAAELEVLHQIAVYRDA
jgi:hypothetical protein